MPFEARQSMMWSDCESEKDEQGRYVHKNVNVGDEVVSVPPKCIERGIVKEVAKVSGRLWADLPSHFAPADASKKPTEARQPEAPPVELNQPTAPPVVPVEEPKPAAPKPRKRGRPRKAKA